LAPGVFETLASGNHGRDVREWEWGIRLAKFIMERFPE
jgi:hypothetical protein